MQYDLTANDIFSTVDTVAFWNGHSSAFGNLYFNFLQLAPNGKIYGVYNGGDSTMTVIDNPNNSGNNCNVIQQGVQLLSYNGRSIPNLPNFRLGPIDGSTCDTLGIDNIIISSENTKPTNKDIRVFPNPTSDNTRIEWYETLQNPTKIEIIGSIGQIIATIKVENNTTYQDIDTKNLSNGMYFIRLSTAKNQTYTTKLIKISD